MIQEIHEKVKVGVNVEEEVVETAKEELHQRLKNEVAWSRRYQECSWNA